MSEKLFYTIGEVAEMFDLPESTLRFWEKHFPKIIPSSGTNNTRRYKAKEIEEIRLVHHLIKEKGMTIKGAQNRLTQNREMTANTEEAARRLQKIKSELKAMLKDMETTEKPLP